VLLFVFFSDSHLTAFTVYRLLRTRQSQGVVFIFENTRGRSRCVFSCNTDMLTRFRVFHCVLVFRPGPSPSFDLDKNKKNPTSVDHTASGRYFCIQKHTRTLSLRFQLPHCRTHDISVFFSWVKVISSFCQSICLWRRVSYFYIKNSGQTWECYVLFESLWNVVVLFPRELTDLLTRFRFFFCVLVFPRPSPDARKKKKFDFCEPYRLRAVLFVFSKHTWTLSLHF
jgi:hypothetical protein